MYAVVHIGVYTVQKKVNVCLAEVHPFTIDVVYTYILYTKNPFNPKGPKSEIFKIFSVDGFFTVDKVYMDRY